MYFYIKWVLYIISETFDGSKKNNTKLSRVTPFNGNNKSQRNFPQEEINVSYKRRDIFHNSRHPLKRNFIEFLSSNTINPRDNFIPTGFETYEKKNKSEILNSVENSNIRGSRIRLAYSQHYSPLYDLKSNSPRGGFLLMPDSIHPFRARVTIIERKRIWIQIRYKIYDEIKTSKVPSWYFTVPSTRVWFIFERCCIPAGFVSCGWNYYFFRLW